MLLRDAATEVFSCIFLEFSTWTQPKHLQQVFHSGIFAY